MTTRMRILLILSFFLLPEMTASAAYQIPMEVSVPVESAQAYNKLVLGAQPGATDQYDTRWDTPALFTTLDPEQPPLLKAYVAHPEYADSRQELWRDIRSDGGVKTWTLNVSLAPSEVGKVVTVSWTLPSSLASSGDQVTLADPDTQKTIDMRSQASYQFVNGSSAESKTLAVTVAPPSGSSDNGSPGFFGCGVVSPVKPGPPPGGGAAAAVLFNLLVLFSPVFLRFRRREPLMID